jgi:Ca2+-binding EF-hand superfamily protein
MKIQLVLLLLPGLTIGAEPVRFERGIRQFTPKADAFALGPSPYSRAAIERLTGPFRRDLAVKFMDNYEVLFLARNRPIRLRVVVKVAGQKLSERFDAHIQELFSVFDRDGDGTLNRYETELIFSREEFHQMLQGGFGFRGQSGELSTQEALDRDSDGQISFEEFNSYYQKENSLMTQTRAVIGEVRGVDQLTTELFNKLDTDQNRRLSEEELKAAEKLLARLDLDEDETLSATELLGTASRANLMGGQGGNSMMMGKNPSRPGTNMTELSTHIGSLPQSAIAELLKRYDTDHDNQLTPKEIGFPKATFDKLDTNSDGKLSVVELEAWRVGEPEAAVTLMCGDKQADCKAEATARPGSGIEAAKQTTPERVVLRFESQTIDLAALPLPESARNNSNPYAYLFPQNKKYLIESELLGPQNQFLRVAFEPADFDGDGKLTRDEFDRYFQLQLKTARLGLVLSYSVRVPNLFQLLDANSDGKLGVKELRTAYARLIPLEPSGGNELTRQILQPSAILRLGHAVNPTLNVGNPDEATRPNQTLPREGPIWFRKMDQNADGDVSRAEFLGSPDDFEKLDTNHDGLISLEEVLAYEKRVRPPSKSVPREP